MSKYLKLLIVGAFALGLGLLFGIARFSRYIRHDPQAVAVADAQAEQAYDHVDEIDTDEELSCLRDKSNREYAAMATRTFLHAGIRETPEQRVHRIREANRGFESENDRVIDNLQDKHDDEDDAKDDFKP